MGISMKINLIESKHLKRVYKNYTLFIIFNNLLLYIILIYIGHTIYRGDKTMEMFFMVIVVVYVALWFEFQERKGSCKQFNVSKVIGDKGESIVAKRLSLLGDEFIVKKDVNIGRAQIDHMVFCIESRDIFVIETKLWCGVISGKCNESMCEQNKNGTVNYFDNPILQNKFHCREVKKDYRDYDVHNIVVFVRNKNVPKSKYIVNIDKLNEYIKTTSKVCNRFTIDIQTD